MEKNNMLMMTNIQKIKIPPINLWNIGTIYYLFTFYPHLIDTSSSRKLEKNGE
jgi:hypothetical protein